MADTPGAPSPESGNDLSQVQTQLAELRASLEATQAEYERVKTERYNQEQRAKKAEAKLREKQTGDENALSDMQQQLEAARSEAELLKAKTGTLESSRKRAEVFSALTAASSKLADGAAKYLGEILLNRVGIDDDGEVVVLNEQGKRRLNPNTGKPMKPQELIDEITAQPDARFLLKAATAGGNGTHGRTDGGGEAVDLDALNSKSAAERSAAWLKLSPEQRAEVARKAGK